MNEDFITLTQNLVKERGKDILNNGKLAKALLMDYAQGKYKSEINLLLKTIELGYPEKIEKTNDLNITKSLLSRHLIEEDFIAGKMAASIVSLLILLIRDEKYNDRFDIEENEDAIKESGEKPIEIAKKNAIPAYKIPIKQIKSPNTNFRPIKMIWIIIVLFALTFLITVAVITLTIIDKGGGKSQTEIPEYSGTGPRYSMFTAIGPIRTRTKDAEPYSIAVDMVIAYDYNDTAATAELTARVHSLIDFVRAYFNSKLANDLQPENEVKLKQEIIEILNTKFFDTAKARMILFRQLDVM
jgi:flagellar FliL protein